MHLKWNILVKYKKYYIFYHKFTEIILNILYPSSLNNNPHKI